MQALPSTFMGRDLEHPRSWCFPVEGMGGFPQHGWIEATERAFRDHQASTIAFIGDRLENHIVVYLLLPFFYNIQA